MKFAGLLCDVRSVLRRHIGETRNIVHWMYALCAMCCVLCSVVRVVYSVCRSIGRGTGQTAHHCYPVCIAYHCAVATVVQCLFCRVCVVCWIGLGTGQTAHHRYPVYIGIMAKFVHWLLDMPLA